MLSFIRPSTPPAFAVVLETLSCPLLLSLPWLTTSWLSKYYSLRTKQSGLYGLGIDDHLVDGLIRLISNRVRQNL
eukprot:2686581-Amphidinium_carterae.1